MGVYLGVINNGNFITADDYKLLDSNNILLLALSAVNKFKINLNNVEYHVNIKLPAKESE